MRKENFTRIIFILFMKTEVATPLAKFVYHLNIESKFCLRIDLLLQYVNLAPTRFSQIRGFQFYCCYQLGASIVGVIITNLMFYNYF